jgi:hypothetical protein
LSFPLRRIWRPEAIQVTVTSDWTDSHRVRFDSRALRTFSLRRMGWTHPPRAWIFVMKPGATRTSPNAPDRDTEAPRPSSHAVHLAYEARLPVTCRLPSHVSHPKMLEHGVHRRPSHEGFAALQRMRQRAATYTEATNSGCAAPSGFLNLLTRSSARNPSGLVSCR